VSQKSDRYLILYNSNKPEPLFIISAHNIPTILASKAFVISHRTPSLLTYFNSSNMHVQKMES